MPAYRALLRPLLFRLDAEAVHGAAIRAAQWAGAAAWLTAPSAAVDPRLAIEVAGIAFRTPLGLAAGFDKSARAVPLLSALGFGHVEVGSISADPSHGNPRPRLFRLPAERAIVVNYGLPNEGAGRVAQRLAAQRRHAPLGINIVSTNRGPSAAPEPVQAVLDDYLRSVRTLHEHADYLCLNLSCPNTRDGRDFFQERSRLSALLDAIDALAIAKPLFLKVAPFAGPSELESFLAAVEPARCVAGFAINLPPGKPAGLDAPAGMPGAVSGRPAAAAADRALAELYRRMDRSRHRLIGSGGVFTAADAYRKIRLGASLVQLLTALVYEGPGVARSIDAGLARLLAADGFAHVADAVGIDALV